MTQPSAGSAPIAELLVREKESLIRAWTRRVREDPAVPEAERLPEPELRDHVPALIDHLAALLGGPAARLPTEEGASVPVELADVSHQHARERFGQGYDVAGALRELAHLRAAIMELAEAHGVATSAEGWAVVHSVLDQAMTNAARTMERAAHHEISRRVAELIAVVQSMPDAVFVGDETGVKFANSAALASLGIASASELRGDLRTQISLLKLRDAATGKPIAYDDQAFVRALRGETVVRDVIARSPVTGEDHVRRSVAAPIELEGRITGAVAVSADITASKRAEARLRVLAAVSQQLAASLDYDRTLETAAHLAVAHLGDYCVLDVLDEHGVLKRRAIVARDPARQALLERASARPPDLVPGSPMYRVLVTGQSEFLAKITPDVIAHVARDEEHRALLEALEPRASILVPLVARDHVLGLLNISTSKHGHRFDADDRVFAEEIGRRIALAVDNARLYREVRSTAEALRREAEMRELFVGILAHDLRDPLGAVTFATAAIERRTDLPRDLPRGLARIANSARRMTAMIDQLTDFTRVRAAGGMPIERRSVDLNPLLNHLADEVRAAFSSRVVHVETEGDVAGFWDADRLAQAFGNLLGNAARHGATASPLRVTARDLGDRVRVSVHNEGTPIPPEILARIFEPFRRGTAPRGTRASVGLGLGLYITDQIVRAHGGSIEVKSDASSGTTFTVTLPRAG